MGNSFVPSARKFKDYANSANAAWATVAAPEVVKATPTPTPTPNSSTESSETPAPTLVTVSENAARLVLNNVVERQLRASSFHSDLEQLIALFECGFVSEEEYSRRKSHLDKLLGIGTPSNDATESTLILNNVEYNLLGIVVNARDIFPAKTAASKPRIVRLFLSSTFRDMQDERDALVKFAFPQLRTFCSERGVMFSEIDLRWGITAEQAESGEVVNICLDEIDKCRPYFVNITGNRYGWIPPSYQESVISRFDFPIDGKSVTELEILYSLKSMSIQPLFYLRKERHVALSRDEADYPEQLEKLRAMLKKQPHKEYQIPSELASMVLEDLKLVIDRDFPMESSPSTLERENNLMHSYAITKSRVYILRKKYLDAITDFVRAPQRTPLVVIGSEGLGKSSLLANYYLRSSGNLIIAHFTGASPESSEHSSFLRRALEIMKKEYKIEEDIPVEIEKLERDFCRWIRTYPTTSKKLILVIDSLDEFTNTATLKWLPSSQQLDEMANTFRLIVSTRLEHSMHTILQTQYPNAKEIRLSELNSSEILALAREYLKLFGKTITPTQSTLLVTSTKHTSNPHFLKLVLEEIRTFGVYERVEQHISYYLRSFSILDLYDRILQRMEKDYEKALVKDILCLLLCSHKGLSDAEILSTMQLINSDITQLDISPILNAFENQNFTVTYNGLVNLNHQSLGHSVAKRYFTSEDTKRRYHCVIAEYFEDLLSSPSTWQVLYKPNIKSDAIGTYDIVRISDELPYHLIEAEHWYRLKKVVCSMPVFLYLCSKDRKYELKKCWILLEKKYYNAGDSYEEAIEELNELKLSDRNYCAILLKVAKFLRVQFEYNSARKILLQLIEKYPYAEKFYTICYVLAQSYWNQGLWNEASVWGKKALEGFKQNEGENSFSAAKCLNGLGEVFIGKGEPDVALRLLEQSLETFKSFFGTEMHHWCSRVMHNMATIAVNKGEFDKSLDLHRRAISIRERVLGMSHPQLGVSFETYGSALLLAGKINEAETAIRKALKINEEVHGPTSINVAGCCEWLTLILRELGRHGEADEVEQRSRSINNEMELRGITTNERTID